MSSGYFRTNVNRSVLSDNLTVKLGIFEITDRSVPVELMCDRAVWVVDTIKGKYESFVAVYDDTIRDSLIREQAITDALRS